MRRNQRFGLILSLSLGASLAPGAARAAGGDDVKASCMAASEQAQKLRLDGALMSARPLFASCARAECPAIVRHDCAQWLGDTIHDTPSVVLAARDEAGHDLVDVHASMDGTDLAAGLDGKAVEIDPGVHHVRFTAPGFTDADVEVVIHTGEKMRAVAVVLSRVEPPAPAAPPPVVEKSAGHGGNTVVALLIGALGLGALGGALALDLGATSDAHTLRATCAPSCSASDVDWIQTRYDLALGALAVGVVSLAAATYFFVRPEPAASGSARAPSVFVGFAPSARGVEGAVGARF